MRRGAFLFCCFFFFLYIAWSYVYMFLGVSDLFIVPGFYFLFHDRLLLLFGHTVDFADNSNNPR